MVLLAFIVALIIVIFNILIFVWRPHDTPCTSCEFYNGGKCTQIQQRLEDSKYGKCFGDKGVIR